MKKYEIAEKIRALIGDVPSLYKLTGYETAALLAAIEKRLAV